MPEYFLFFILLIAALSHAICHSILKHNKNPLGLLGITSLFEIIIFPQHLDIQHFNKTLPHHVY